MKIYTESAKIIMMKKFTQKFFVANAEEMMKFGARIGAQLRGGEIFELIGDIGAGKTTFVKGLARGLLVDENVQSPSFTISQNYFAKSGLTLHHYDFYRLADPGIMQLEIAENLRDKNAITVIEWGESVREILPENHIEVKIHFRENAGREIEIYANEKQKNLLENLL